MPGPTTVARGNVVMEMVLQVTLTPPTVNANTTAEATYTVPGVLVGDFLEINKPSHTTGLSVGNIRASAADTVAIQFVNNTGSNITNAPTEAYLFAVTRFENLPSAPPSGIV